MTTPASLVLEFGDDVESGALAVAELDDVLNLDADGEVISQFAPGDRVHFLVHHDPTIRIAYVHPTSGQVSAQGQVTRTRILERVLLTEGEPEYELPYIVSGSIGRVWYGNQAGIVRLGRIITGAGELPAVGDLTVSVRFHSFVFDPPPLTLAEDEVWPVRIVIRMENAA